MSLVRYLIRSRVTRARRPSQIARPYTEISVSTAWAVTETCPARLIDFTEVVNSDVGKTIIFIDGNDQQSLYS